MILPFVETSPFPASVTAAVRAKVSRLFDDLVDDLALLVLLAVLVLVLLTFRDYGISWDEEGENTYGKLVLAYYASGFRDRSAFEFANLYYYGGGFDLLAAIVNLVSPFGEYETRHLLGGLVGVLGLAGVWRLARRTGGARAGMLAVLLLAITPSWYGHMFINPKDLPFAAGIVWLVLFMVRIIEELPAVGLRTALGFGLVLGLVLGTRIGGVIALPDLAVPVLLWLAVQARESGRFAFAVRDAGRIAWTLLPALPVAYAVMALLWPWAVQAPLNPLRALTLFSHFPFGGLVLFEGELVPAVDLPASYLPVHLAVTQPELLLAGLAAAAVLGGIALWREPGALLRPRGLQVLAVALAAALPVVAFLLLRPVAYNGIRHFLFVLPPMAVLAALAFDRLLGHGPGLSPLGGRTVLLPLGAAVAVQVWVLAALHPDEYVYFNSLVGGVRGAQGRYELDYWATSLAEAARRLADRLESEGEVPPPGAPPYKVYVCADPLTASYVFPPWLEPVGRIGEADFQIAVAQFYCDSPPGSRRLVRVERLGALLSYADDLRPLAKGPRP